LSKEYKNFEGRDYMGLEGKECVEVVNWFLVFKLKRV
jgi:hypothetical protein